MLEELTVTGIINTCICVYVGGVYLLVFWYVAISKRFVLLEYTWQGRVVIENGDGGISWRDNKAAWSS